MRHGRAKAARKTLQFFRINVGIAPPYQVILDGTFLVAMVVQKVPLHERFDRTLQHEKFVIHVTRSSLNELETLHTKSKKEMFAQARQWGLDNSDIIIEDADIPKDGGEQLHEDLGAPGKEIVQLVEAKPQYLVCSQDETLLDLLRFKGKTPLIRLSRGVLLLENPSKSGQAQVSSKEKAKWSVGGTVKEHEKKLVETVREKQREERQESKTENQPRQPRGRVKSKAKGPNPLSCKKKRSANDEEQSRRKRRRKTQTEKI